MPHSLVLNLFPMSPIPPGYLTGKHFHALFLTLVSSVDRELGTLLHDAKTDKAFALSPLQVSNYSHRDRILQWEHRQAIAAGTPCWWRISLLDDSLFGHLTSLWLNLNPQHPWHLGPADLQITSILGTSQSNQPWANFSSYSQLYDRASDSERQIEFTFCTPTAFRQSNFDNALPTRESVFGSLLRRWNQYSGMPFSENVSEFIYPSFFNIRTEIVTDARSKFIGCVGAITFRILGEVEPTIIKQINALADFALYSGVGRKTPMGMGMVIRHFPKRSNR
ncbi:CRISPR-associated endoribonuclease Cas6 [Aerosakkonema funiforme]|uniref:CRISPR-associated endoribonuclease Cas6 n=1 Tax=Aerosakkonema funiforme FACHB-1375 TaxID=2949571 RepID=A0A926ZIB9_9CYAN|nr:CRISPR-associated endoribonuclease Cas6 [Aerosakkonema funiforme]MBD2183920.1 CRISPR-associated endoribonuclease Cas6 [Aerosakkonema funiforme FACHB-1375]